MQRSKIRQQKAIEKIGKKKTIKSANESIQFGFVTFDSKHILRNNIEKTNIRFFLLRTLPEISFMHEVMNFLRNGKRARDKTSECGKRRK